MRVRALVSDASDVLTEGACIILRFLNAQVCSDCDRAYAFHVSVMCASVMFLCVWMCVILYL